jgi:hypothetical protein
LYGKTLSRSLPVYEGVETQFQRFNLPALKGKELKIVKKPSPWAPPSEAHRRLGELQTIRAGIIASLTEWKNRKNSGIADAEAQALADATISHFMSQLGAVDKAIKVH